MKKLISIVLALTMLLTLPVTASATLTSADALQILRYAAGTITLSESDLTRLDLNKDGKVNSADALFVLRYVAGVINLDGTPRVIPSTSTEPLNVDNTTIEMGLYVRDIIKTNHSDVKWSSSDPAIVFVTQNYRDVHGSINNWGAGIHTSNKTGQAIITGSRPNGETIRVTVTVTNPNPSTFNPANYPNLVEAPLPTTPEYNPFIHINEQATFYEYRRVINERIVWEEINNVRIAERQQPLSWDTSLAEAARLHSIDQNTNNFRGHTGSDGSVPANRARIAGFKGDVNAVGEIIAFNGFSRAVNDWLNSEGHKRIMMDAFDDVVGVGIDNNIVVVKVADSTWGV
jgi:uncharacterized protein YkwD